MNPSNPPPGLQLRHRPTPEAIAEAAAVEWLGLLMRRADLSVPYGIALSGGRIAKAFYQAIARGAAGRPGLFENVHFFWADERCVPPSDPENNFSIAREHLFEPLAIPAANIHRLHGEITSASEKNWSESADTFEAEFEKLAQLDRDWRDHFSATNDYDYASAEAESELCRLMPLSAAGQPVLDLIILGMGEDGHVASLFPAESADWVDHPKVYRKVRAAKPPPERITLGYQPILAAREVWVLASGPGKAAALQGLLLDDQALPIARITARRPSTTIFQDIDKSLGNL